MRRAALLIAVMLPFGCHLLFPFEVDAPAPNLADSGAEAWRPGDGAREANAPDSAGDLIGPREASVLPDLSSPPDATVTPDAPAPLTWSVMASPVNTVLYSVWGRSQTEVYAAGQSGVVLHYNGAVWKKLPWISGATGATYYAVRGSGPAYVYVAGDNSTVRRCNASSCGPPPFQDAKLPLPYYLRGLWCSSYNRCYIAGHDGVSIPGFFVGDGLTSVVPWPELCKGVPGYAGQRLYGLWGRAWNDVVVTGTSGTVLHHSSAGCKKIPVIPAALYFGAWAPPGAGLKDLFIVGGGGALLRHDGTNWNKINTGVSVLLTAVWGRSAGDVVAVGTQGVILHYNGTKVTQPAAGLTTKSINAVWGDAGGYFAVGYGGVIVRGTSKP